MKNFIKSNILALVALVIAIIAVVIVISLHGSSQSFGSISGSVSDPNETNFTTIGTKAISIGNKCQDGFSSSGCIGNGQTTLGDLAFNQVIATSSRQQATAATTTPCSILSPAATSSLAFWDFNVSTAGGLSSTTLIELGTSTNPATLGSGFASGMSIPTSTPAFVSYDPGTNTSLVPPSTYVITGITSTNTTTALVGSCQAIFILP